MDEILKILYECLPYDPDFNTCFVDPVRLRIAAKKIAKLHNKEMEKLANQLGISTAPPDCFKHRGIDALSYRHGKQETGFEPAT